MQKANLVIKKIFFQPKLFVQKQVIRDNHHIY